MQAYVSIEACRSAESAVLRRESYQRAWKRVEGLSFDRISSNPSAVPVDRPDLVAQIRAIFDEEFEADMKPLYEVLIVPRPELPDLERAAFIIFGLLGDDASGSDAVDTAEGPGYREYSTTCSHCGNSYVDQPKELNIRGRRLPSGQQFFSFFSEMSLFCRPSFKTLIKQKGLTGLEFKPISPRLTDGIDLLLVRPIQHNWSSGPSVCMSCGMKTNIRYIEFFNCYEDYRFDFQYVRVFGGHFFVLSQRAIDCVSQVSHTKIQDARIPVAPGELAQWIAPPEKFYGHGNYPTRVLSY